MSKQRIIKDEIWDDEWFYDLDPSEKLLWLFLLTNPRTNIAGVYKLNVRWAANITGFDKDVVTTILKRFVKDGKIVYEDDWLAIVNFGKHLSHKNPSVIKGIERIGETLTGCPQAVYSVYLTLLNLTLLNLSDSESNDSRIPNKEIKSIMDYVEIDEDGYEIGKLKSGRIYRKNDNWTWSKQYDRLKRSKSPVDAIVAHYLTRREISYKNQGEWEIERPGLLKLAKELAKAGINPELMEECMDKSEKVKPDGWTLWTVKSVYPEVKRNL